MRENTKMNNNSCQDMSTLFSSLRSLLPDEYIQENESISDNLEDAARYIKDLERNVEELERKRDLLKKTSLKDNGSSSNANRDDNPSNKDDYVKINTCLSGIEIEISVNPRDEDDVFPLSQVLKMLLEEGLSVVNCVSSLGNTRWVYIIHCQVNDEKLFDSARLQGRLASVISS